MKLRALKAKHGDSLLLIENDVKVLIDGGPSGVYNQTLHDALESLDDIEDDNPPLIDLVMVSHIDADHIDGILDLTADLLEAQEDDSDPIVNISGAWHNSFADMIASLSPEKSSTVTASAGLLNSELNELLTDDQLKSMNGKLVLESVAQGRQLRLDLKALKIPTNKNFKNKVVLQENQKKVWKKDSLEITVIGPTHKELDRLQKKWASELPKILAKKQASLAAASELDTSVSNLASIVCIAEAGNQSILLTGDARGDMILEWLKNTNRLDESGKAHFDILKMPHHGSDRNISKDFLKRITAASYVFCGNGGHGNPEPNTLKMLFEARPSLDYTIYMTYGPDELSQNKAFKKHNNPIKLEQLLLQIKA